MSDPVLVTGSASGIGRSVAEQLVAAGTPVIGLDRSDDAPAGVTPLVVDLSEPDSVAAAVAGLPDRLGGVANVAGLPGSHPAPLVLGVNVLAPRLLTELTASRLVPGSAFVVVSSVAAHRSPLGDDAVGSVLATADWESGAATMAGLDLDGPAAYDFSKKVVNELALRTAASWIGTGVRCLTVSPGPVETPILADFTATMGEASMQASAGIVGRHARPEEVAAVVVFALSTAASWVNAVDLRTDGGLLGVRNRLPKVGA